LGPAAYIGRARVVPLRNTGAALSPFNAFLILQGIETLSWRMDRINDNTLKVAQFLQAHPKAAWVNYAGLPSHPDHALVQKYLGGKAGGLLTFGVTSAPGEGRVAGAVLDALQLFTRLVNIGDAKSLATHPASTTHRQLSPAGLTKAGVPEDAVRLSIGMSTLTICWQIWHRRWLPFKPLRASLTGTWASSPMPPASLRCGQGRHHE
jgi:O-acetylhomoserine (thiol)-lyase